MEEVYVGVLLCPLVYGGIRNKLKYYENLAFYEDGAKKNNLIPCFFRLQDIHPGQDILTAYVRGEEGRYHKKEIPKPEVIHNRAFIQSSAGKRKIKELQAEGIKIFNENNRYTKMHVHELLTKKNELKPFLPETVRCNKANLQKMMEKYKDIIIKPNNGSLGNKVFKLSTVNGNAWELSYYLKKRTISEVFYGEWPEKLRRIAANPRYIIQERIPLACRNGSPFDLRVSVQRGGAGNWQVSGIVGKLAIKGNYLTNVSRGGKCRSLRELLTDSPHLSLEKVEEDIERLSIDIAEQLAKYLPNLADIGLDIGITSLGVPMFIECNARDLRITFRNAKLMEEWKKTHTTPMDYARFLYDKKRELNKSGG